MAPAADVMGRFSPVVDVTFDRLWESFLEKQRHLEETTAGLNEDYGKNHFLPFFGGHDIGLTQRTPPLRASDGIPGAIYVDGWAKEMPKKEKRDNVGRSRPGTVLSIKFIKNLLTVLGQAFDVALQERPAALLQVNPARDIRLPKQVDFGRRSRRAPPLFSVSCSPAPAGPTSKNGGSMTGSRLEPSLRSGAYASASVSGRG